MKFRVVKKKASGAHSPVFVIEEDTGQGVGWVNRYLDDPGLYREQRASIVRDWVQFTDGQSGRRLGDAILRHAGLEPPAAALKKAPDYERQCVLR